MRLVTAPYGSLSILLQEDLWQKNFRFTLVQSEYELAYVVEHEVFPYDTGGTPSTELQEVTRRFDFQRGMAEETTQRGTQEPTKTQFVLHEKQILLKEYSAFNGDPFCNPFLRLCK